MRKIWLIIKREYLVRVRKKSFIVMTIVGPLLMVALMIFPNYLANQSQEVRTIAIDEDGFEFTNQIKDTDFLNFSKIPNEEADLLKNDFSESSYYALLHIDGNNFTLYSNQQISLSVSKAIENQLEQIIEHQKLKAAGIDLDILSESESTVRITTKIITEDGNTTKSKAEASMGIGFICGILIYIFIFMYGTMVMRGVIEEKTSRIVEVIISSVKPFQLMLGKIIGNASAGLLQFLIWGILIFIITTVASSIFGIDMVEMQTAKLPAEQLEAAKQAVGIDKMQLIILEILRLPILKMFVLFIFYFLGGFMLYSSMFAAIGAAVDNETDTQQFMLPIMLPLILGVYVGFATVINDPHGSIAVLFSHIPFTSPIVMLMRVPFGVSWTELIISMTLLLVTFVFMVWLAAKIYRVGILMYGKKPTYKDLYKWLKYKG